VRAFSIVIPVRSSDAQLLLRNLDSWKALGSDDLILCTNGKLEGAAFEDCRVLDSSQAEEGWFYRQGGARRFGFQNAKNNIILTGDVDLSVTPECLKAVDLLRGDIGMISLEKQRGAPGPSEAMRRLSKRMLRRIRHRMFFTGLYVLNREAWLDTDDLSTSKELTRKTLKGEDFLLKQSMLRSNWRVVYLPIVGGVDHRIAFEDRPEGQLEAGRKAWAEQLSPFSVTVRSLLYSQPLLLGRYLAYARRSGNLTHTIAKIPLDGVAMTVRRAVKR
jgi:hypothetical protein